MGTSLRQPEALEFSGYKVQLLHTAFALVLAIMHANSKLGLPVNKHAFQGLMSD